MAHPRTRLYSGTHSMYLRSNGKSHVRLLRSVFCIVSLHAATSSGALTSAPASWPTPPRHACEMERCNAPLREPQQWRLGHQLHASCAPMLRSHRANSSPERILRTHPPILRTLYTMLEVIAPKLNCRRPLRLASHANSLPTLVCGDAGRLAGHHEEEDDPGACPSVGGIPRRRREEYRTAAAALWLCRAVLPGRNDRLDAGGLLCLSASLSLSLSPLLAQLPGSHTDGLHPPHSPLLCPHSGRSYLSLLAHLPQPPPAYYRSSCYLSRPALPEIDSSAVL